MAKKRRFKRNDNNYAIAYYRYSSSSQSELSIPDQQVKVHAYAEAHGYEIVAEYEDPARTGRDDNRPGFQRMIREAEALRPSALIVWKMDRIARSRSVSTRYKDKLFALGCDVVSVTESVGEVGTSGRVMSEGMLETFAEFYSAQLSENVVRGMYGRANEARFLGHKKFGYCKGDDGRYAPDPVEAPLVVKMFEDYADGRTAKEIAAWLNGMGVKTGKGKKKWTVGSVTKVLHADRYIGVYRFGDVEIDDGMPVLIDDDLWKRVQRKLKLNKHAKAGEDPDAPRYWLTGKVFCGHCGETMRGTHGTSKTGKRHYYYACKGKQQHSGCSKRHERKEYLEEYVLDALRYLLWDEETRSSIAADAAAWYAENAGDDTMLRALEEQLRETSTALDNVMSAIEQGIITTSTKERLLELEDSKEQLEKQIAIERAKAALAADEHTIEAYFERYADADLDDPRVRDGVLDYFIDKVYVYDDGTLDLVGWFTSAHDTLHVSLSDLDGDMMRGIHGELEECGDDDGGMTGEDSGLEFEPLPHGPATK